MNLPDLIKRKDRAVSIAAGKATPEVRTWKKEPRCVVILAPGTELILEHADEFECLRGLPQDVAWRIWVPEGFDGEHHLQDVAQTSFSIHAKTSVAPFQSKVLFTQNLLGKKACPILLDWPQWARSGAFNLLLRNNINVPIAVDSEPSFDSRRHLLPLISGKGVEIGPGLNPHILPSDKVDVRYIESMPAEEWFRNYKKTDKPSVTEQNNLWLKYIVADAQKLTVIPDYSLDFIYSNHVFEHLMNPLGVLENWRRKLAPSGIIVGIVPDCRYVFDLRQFPSTVEDWLKQRHDGAWKIESEQYERWCKYTAPYNTPENLIERNYSIHVHFYTPDSFTELGNILSKQELFDEIHIDSSPNHKDFGFLLRANSEWTPGATNEIS